LPPAKDRIPVACVSAPIAILLALVALVPEPIAKAFTPVAS
jgi:hypothetical protein